MRTWHASVLIPSHKGINWSAYKTTTAHPCPLERYFMICVRPSTNERGKPVSNAAWNSLQSFVTRHSGKIACMSVSIYTAIYEEIYIQGYVLVLGLGSAGMPLFKGWVGEEKRKIFFSCFFLNASNAVWYSFFPSISSSVFHSSSGRGMHHVNRLESMPAG